MLFNTNTWALSPKAIFIRLAALLLLGVLIVGWIDHTFPPITKNPARMVHNTVLQVDTLKR